MARFAKDLQKQKMLYAKDLYIKRFDYGTIANMLNVSEATIKKWGKENDFESARQASFIALSELRNTVLQSFVDLKEGRKPKIKPDEAAKYASAFEKLSDKRKTLTYIYEAYEMLTEELLLDIQNAKNKTDKERTLQIIQYVRAKTDKIITRVAGEVDNE